MEDKWTDSTDNIFIDAMCHVLIFMELTCRVSIFCTDRSYDDFRVITNIAKVSWQNF